MNILGDLSFEDMLNLILTPILALKDVLYTKFFLQTNFKLLFFFVLSGISTFIFSKIRLYQQNQETKSTSKFSRYIVLLCFFLSYFLTLIIFFYL